MGQEKSMRSLRSAVLEVICIQDEQASDTKAKCLQDVEPAWGMVGISSYFSL